MTQKTTVSQTEQVLEHLKSGKTITPLESLELFGCLRLSARIMDLRKQGYEIDTDIIEEGDKHFARYKLRKNFKTDLFAA